MILRFLVLAAGMAVTMADQNCSCDNNNSPYIFQITTPPLLPSGTVGTAYSAQVEATGAIGSVTWSISSGALPAGLSLGSTTGQITGTPTTPGTSTPLIQAKDNGTGGGSTARQFTITISAGSNPVPSIITLSPNSTIAGATAFTLTITGTNFVSGATVGFGADSGLAPITLTSSQITVTIPASDVATAGNVPVTVTNPPPGGGTSTPPANFVVSPQTKTFGNGVIVGPGNTPALNDDGKTLVDGFNTSVNGGAASAYVYSNANGIWGRVALLQSTTGIASVAISGDGHTIVIGDCAGNACSGNVYVYVEPGCPSACSGWNTAPSPMPATATLNASNTAVSTRFGIAVATDKTGDTIAVGAPCDYTAGITLCGTVYVYLVKTGWTNRTEDAQLQIAITGAGNATLGLSVAMDSAGQTIAAGLPGVAGAGNPPVGAAFVFVQPGCPGACTGWATTHTATANLTPSQASNPASGDNFGWAIGISGNGATVVVGSPYHAGAGAAYVFVNSSAPAGWTSTNETSILTANNGQSGDHFGNSIGMPFSGSTIVIGAPHPFTSSATPGAAYVFDAGTQNQQLAAFAGNDIFGNSVTPQQDFGSSNPFGDGPGVALSSDGSTLAIGGLATIGTTSNQQEVWIFQ